MGHKAQLPSGEAVCCCRALCIMRNIPVVASVCGHSCSSAELLHKVCHGCCWFFFPSGFFHLPAVRRDHMAQLLHQDLQAVPTQAVHQSRAACRRRKRRREGGREGRRWARLLPRAKSQNIQGLCCETGSSPPCPHEPCYRPPQPALSAWYKMLVWSPSPLFLAKVSLAGGPQLAGSSVPRASSGNNSGQPPLAVIWKVYGMAWHGMEGM